MNNKNNYQISRTTKQLGATGKDGEAKFFLEGANQAAQPPAAKSLGSFATHVYVNDITREIIFVNQVQLKIDDSGEAITEFIASKALDELRLQLMNQFGRKENGRLIT